MKKMYYLVALVSVSVFLISCDDDDAPYYDVRDEYAGRYGVDDYCDIGVSDYVLDIYKSDYDDEIVFGFPGLFESGMDVYAIVTGMKIIIPIQQFHVSTFPDIFYEFSGSGSLEDSVLTVEYQVLTVQNGLITDDVDCSAKMIRE
ncbi:MAG: hypothetical protein H7Y00_02445 [Fimbriimonadaceae bacterium]|nr:hypothetical protein [Chitinophagales bacterium]